MTNPDDKYPGQFTDIHTPDPEEARARRGRNRWLGLALAAFVILVGLITFIRLSSSDLSKGGFYYSTEDKGSDSESALPPGMTEEQAAPPPNLTPVEEAPAAEPEGAPE